MNLISPKHKKLYSIVNKIEELFAQNSDVLISPTPKLLKSFKRQPKICELVLNCPKDHRRTKSKQPTKGFLTLAFAGNIVKQRGLERVSLAIKDVEGVEFIIAGRVLDKDFFEQILKIPNVKYKGLLYPSEALSMDSNSDVIVSLYDLTVPNYNLAYAVKNFDAMMLGLPVITNISKELIDEVDFGIMVDYNDLNQIKTTIIRLRDDIQLRKKLGANARKGFEQKYNWKNQEEKLYKIYDRFFQE